MAEKRSKKHLPRIDEENKWFWEACARHELILQKCRACSTLRYTPRALCPACLSAETDYVRSSGRGRVYTFTVTVQNQAPGFREELPYVLAYVELDDGPRILSNVVGIPPEEVSVGMPVAVEFEDVAEGLSLPKFRKAEP